MSKKWPKKLIMVAFTDGDERTLMGVETPDDISEDFADKEVAVYELVTVGKFSVDKQVDAKPPTSYWAERNKKKPTKAKKR
jgi:hypothetical protein